MGPVRRVRVLGPHAYRTGADCACVARPVPLRGLRDTGATHPRLRARRVPVRRASPLRGALRLAFIKTGAHHG